jgi:hypothetical protein
VCSSAVSFDGGWDLDPVICARACWSWMLRGIGAIAAGRRCSAAGWFEICVTAIPCGRSCCNWVDVRALCQLPPRRGRIGAELMAGTMPSSCRSISVVSSWIRPSEGLVHSFTRIVTYTCVECWLLWFACMCYRWALHWLGTMLLSCGDRVRCQWFL